MMIFSSNRWWAMAALTSLGSIGVAGEGPSRQSAAPIRMISSDLAELPPAPAPELSGGSAGSSSAPPSPVSPAKPEPTATPPPAQAANPTGPVKPSVPGVPAPVWVNRWGLSPPPGTLGQTYRRQSALVPDDAHPRTGVVMVYLPEDADVSARGLKVSWTGEAWRLETAQALVPGLSHIYAIRAEWDTPEGRAYETRWVRLIMGRVVDLEF